MCGTTFLVSCAVLGLSDRSRKKIKKIDSFVTFIFIFIPTLGFLYFIFIFISSSYTRFAQKFPENQKIKKFWPNRVRRSTLSHFYIDPDGVTVSARFRSKSDRPMEISFCQVYIFILHVQKTNPHNLKLPQARNFRTQKRTKFHISHEIDVRHRSFNQ